MLATEFRLDAPRENVKKNTLRNFSSTFPCRGHLKSAIYFCRRNLELPESKLNSEDRRRFPWAKSVLGLNRSLLTKVLSSTDEPAVKPTKASEKLPKAKVEPPKANSKPSIVLGITNQIPVLYPLPKLNKNR